MGWGGVGGGRGMWFLELGVFWIFGTLILRVLHRGDAWLSLSIDTEISNNQTYFQTVIDSPKYHRNESNNRAKRNLSERRIPSPARSTNPAKLLPRHNQETLILPDISNQKSQALNIENVHHESLTKIGEPSPLILVSSKTHIHPLYRYLYRQRKEHEQTKDSH